MYVAAVMSLPKTKMKNGRVSEANWVVLDRESSGYNLCVMNTWMGQLLIYPPPSCVTRENRIFPCLFLSLAISFQGSYVH